MKRYEEQENLKKGWYHKPHFLYDLLFEGQITKSEFLLLDYLYYQWAMFHYKVGYFFRTDSQICATGLISQKTISRARKGLVEKGYIKIKQGHSRRATEYAMLIEIADYGFDVSQYKRRL